MQIDIFSVFIRFWQKSIDYKNIVSLVLIVVLSFLKSRRQTSFRIILNKWGTAFLVPTCLDIWEGVSCFKNYYLEQIQKKWCKIQCLANLSVWLISTGWKKVHWVEFHGFSDPGLWKYYVKKWSFKNLLALPIIISRLGYILKYFHSQNAFFVGCFIS